MENIIKHIDPMLIPVIIALWVIGRFIKESETIRNNLIPVLLVPCAIVLVALWSCTQGIPVTGGEWLALAVNALIQGILCAAVAVWGNQVVKQLGEMEG